MSGQPAIGTPTTAIGIDARNLAVIDPGLASKSIIEISSPFDLQVEVELGGLFASWLVSLPLTFTVHYYIESFGSGYEGELASKQVTTAVGKLTYNAETRVTVPAGAWLPAGSGPIGTPPANKLTPGTYKLTAVVTFAGAPPVPMTAFTEGGVIQVF